jgi:hypothetical protein
MFLEKDRVASPEMQPLIVPRSIEAGERYGMPTRADHRENRIASPRPTTDTVR